MAKSASRNDQGTNAPTGDRALESRVFAVMAASVVVAVLLSSYLASWRVTTGLLLGGLLSLLNYHWMRTSIGSLIAATAGARKVSHRASRYVLRYAVIGTTVLVAYKLNLVSLPATIIGLCSFVVALFAEAFRAFYFAIVHREGIN